MNLRVNFGPQTCGDLAIGAEREWLVPDGLGGYAMGTVSGLRTRRYHALLVVAEPGGSKRHVGLVALDPVLTLPSGAIVELGVHEWHDETLAPRGHELLSSFSLADGLPSWRWRIGSTVIERRLAMRHGSPCLAVTDTLISGGPVTLTLRALVTWRDAHGERRDGDGQLTLEAVGGGVVVGSAYRLKGPQWSADGEWWKGARLRAEAERGLNAEEDLLLAGTFSTTLHEPGQACEVLAWAGDLATEPPPARKIITAAAGRNAGIDTAADTFIVTTPAGPDVIAGYPWFGAWSRDTMTSYEGLFLTTGRSAEGAALLRAYASTLSEGMLANTADTGSVEHNTADATLWFVHALGRHVDLTGDIDLAHELTPALRDLYDWHITGTRYGIRVDPVDGLLRQGAPGEALTWMDARVDGEPITQRAGKAADINALWCNTLGVFGALGVLPDARHHDTAVASFRARFPAGRWLLDTADPDDPAVRPNQLLAYSLPYAPMAPDAAALGRIADELLTPLGLCSLSPADPSYRGRHRGGPADRDRAYHQGTVWPWLIGPLADAMRRAGLPLDGLLDGLTAHRSEAGLGSISETADGDAPHSPTGCPFQAWSVAEYLRAAGMR